MCLRTGRPPTLANEQCDLTLPTIDGNNPHLTENEKIPLSLFCGNLRLSIIQSRIYTDLYFPQALRKSDAELLKTIRDLDSTLEEWRESLPPLSQPIFGLGHELPTCVTDARSVLFQVQYLYCMAAIHQTSSRCEAWRSIHDQRMGDGIASSITVSATASRSLLQLFRISTLGFERQSFWFSLFYPISAAVTLFCNILLDPHDSKCEDDARLIRNLPAAIYACLGQHLSPSIADHMKLVNSFIPDLANLVDYIIVILRCGEQGFPSAQPYLSHTPGVLFPQSPNSRSDSHTDDATLEPLTSLDIQDPVPRPELELTTSSYFLLQIRYPLFACDCPGSFMAGSV
ncbi:hypothetical protein BO71DRAFT_441276 [Aspergillus ellipticus CBS 707.79]|uniref:Transcription factor domain-containing protein n=1 Tax=Aspergillus ellipticus CBS 707.79 TaxID=1448320 RepID=A0A319DIW8_9EURO|nr:hypothetical protein BO71DRAFT_441276 [Aspergillus ellipticus CBS 707.79]